MNKVSSKLLSCEKTIEQYLQTTLAMSATVSQGYFRYCKFVTSLSLSVYGYHIRIIIITRWLVVLSDRDRAVMCLFKLRQAQLAHTVSVDFLD